MRLPVLLLPPRPRRFALPGLLALVALGTTSTTAQETGGAARDLGEGAERLQADATLFPIPAYEGDMVTREALLGNWGGARTVIATESGIQVAIDVNQFYFGIWDGGRSEESDYNGSADYYFRFDSGQAGLWPGGFLEVHGETYWGSSVNRATGALLPVNTDIALAAPAGAGTYLSHVVYTQFLAENLAVFFGKIDTTIGDSNRFAHGPGDERFMNLGFAFNPVTLRSSPYSTLGFGVLYLPSPGLSVTFSMFDTDGAIDRSGFDNLFEGNTTFAGEVGVDTDFFDEPGRHTFGFLGSNKDFLSTNQDPRLFLPVFDEGPKTEDGTWAFYWNFDQFIVSDPNDPPQGWGLFGRFGVSDGKANPIHHFYSVGLGGTGIVPGRDDDQFGVGYYYFDLTDERLGIFSDDGEYGVELFYNLAVTPWFDLTADLQVIDGAGRFSDTAVVGGLRGQVRF